MRSKHLLSAAALCVSLVSASLAEVVSLDGLLDEMTDLKRLAELPEPAYITRQFSSYDRAAKSPKENWFANGDSGHFLRVEKRDGRDEYVMADIDGESFPSTFGAGSEDYYGYAWGSSELYAHAYHNQPRCDGPGVYGNSLESRFHIIDDMPFTKSFKFDMENWHSAEGVKVTRAAVSYWYVRPGGTDFFKPITKADVQLTEVPPFPTSRP